MGYAWPAVNGFDYWTLDGVKLSALGLMRAESDGGLSTPN